MFELVSLSKNRNLPEKFSGNSMVCLLDSCLFYCDNLRIACVELKYVEKNS